MRSGSVALERERGGGERAPRCYLVPVARRMARFWDLGAAQGRAHSTLFTENRQGYLGGLLRRPLPFYTVSCLRV